MHDGGSVHLRSHPPFEALEMILINFIEWYGAVSPLLEMGLTALEPPHDAECPIDRLFLNDNASKFEDVVNEIDYTFQMK